MSWYLQIPAIAWLLVSGIFFGFGEFLSKKWADHPSLGMTLFVIVVYSCSTLCWLPVLLHRNSISIMGSIWLLLATLLTIGIGVLIFKEGINTYQIIGIALAIFAMILLNLE